MELVKRLHEVIHNYEESYNAVMRNEDLEKDKNWPRVVEVQELFNKELEEL